MQRRRADAEVNHSDETVTSTSDVKNLPCAPRGRLPALLCRPGPGDRRVAISRTFRHLRPRTRAAARKWDIAKRKRRQRQFDSLIAHYIATVERAAQYSVYQRFFAWWHILHIPFVYLLVASAIYHVIAVFLVADLE